MYKYMLASIVSSVLFMYARLLLQNKLISDGKPIIHWQWAMTNIVVAGLHSLALTRVFDLQWTWITCYLLSLFWIIFDLMWNVKNHGWSGWNYVDDPDPDQDDAVTDTLMYWLADRLGVKPWIIQYVLKLTFLVVFFLLGSK